MHQIQKDIIYFFESNKSIIKKQFCFDSGISVLHLNNVLSEKNNLSKIYYRLILPTLEKYGYEQSKNENQSLDHKFGNVNNLFQ